MRTFTLLIAGLLLACAAAGQHAFFDAFPAHTTWPNIRVAATHTGDWALANDLAQPLQEGGKHGFYVMRYDSCGRSPWSVRVDADSFALFFSDIATLPTGAVLAAGQTGTGDVFLLRLGAAGDLQGFSTFEASVFDQCHALATDPSGGLALLGAHQSGGRTLNWILRLDAQGSLLWSYSYPLNSGGRDATGIGSLVRSADGWIARNGNLIFKINDSGSLLWARELEGVDPVGGRWSNGVALPGGGYAIACRISSLSAFVVLALGADGTLLGQSPMLMGIDEPPTLALAPDGRLAFGAPTTEGAPAITWLDARANWLASQQLSPADEGQNRRLALAGLPPHGLALAGVNLSQGNRDFAATFRFDGDFSCLTTATDTRLAGNFPASFRAVSLAQRAVPFMQSDSALVLLTPFEPAAERRCDWSRDAKDWPIDSSITCTDLLEWHSPLQEATYRWYDGATDSVRTLKAPGRYPLTASTCRTDYLIDIDLRLGFCPCNWYVPNAFSPNGDAFNDYWEVFQDCPWTSFELQLYDRWGAQVYRTNQPNPGWDGTIGGKPAPEGVYVYRIQYQYNIQPLRIHENTLSGTLNLVR